MKTITTFVAGYSVVETLDKKDRKQISIALLVRDVVGKNPMVKVKANKNGSIWIDKGFTLDEVKKEYPYGTPVLGYQWGKEKQTTYGGVYKLEPVELVEEEVEKE